MLSRTVSGLFGAGGIVALTGCIPISNSAENRGQDIVEAKWMSCHATRTADEGAAPEPPAFCCLAQDNYRVAKLKDALLIGIGTGHAPMPVTQLTDAEVEVVIAYLNLIQLEG